MRSQDLLQHIHVHAVVVHLDAYHLGTVGPEGIQRAGIGGIFRNHHRTGGDQALGQISQALLGTAGNEDVLVIDVVDLIALHKFHQIHPQGIVSVGGGVLDRLAPFIGENLVADLLQIMGGEKLLAGQTAGEGDHLDALFGLIPDLRSDAADGGGAETV